VHAALQRTSGESGPKDQVALQWHYTSLSYWCTAARTIEIVRYARIISRHADGISRYSVLADQLVPAHFYPCDELNYTLAVWRPTGKPVPDMTYNVFGGTLNPAQSSPNW